MHRARLIKKRREELNLTQAQLGALLGNAGASWVSQVEKGKLTPGRDRMDRLAAILGPEIRMSDDEEPDFDALTFACLWRARADMLDRLSSNVGIDRRQRRRLRQLSDDLAAAAADHPHALRYLQYDRLARLEDLTDGAPEWLLRMVLIEIAGMKLDAPSHTRYPLGYFLELLEHLVLDLGIENADQVHQWLTDAYAKPACDHVEWTRLAPFGGSVGRVHAALADPTGRLALLLGHDPVGWLGTRYLAGRWLLPVPLGGEISSAAGEVGATDGVPADRAARVDYFWPSAAAAGTGAAAAGLAAGGALLGSVLGAGIGVSIASQLKAATARRAAAAQKDEAGTDGNGDVDAAMTAALCIAFGRHWVRHEANKVYAMYATFREDWVPSGSAEAGIVPLADALTHLQLVDDQLHKAQDAEVESLGGGGFDSVERLAATAGSILHLHKALSRLS